MAYVNFVIELSALPNGQYRIQVQSSPVGEASADVNNPFTDDEIRQILAVLGRQKRVSRMEETQTARQFGQRLFEFLIQNNQEINTAYFASLDRAGNDGLRIRLSTEDGGPLATLPWELMRDPNRDFLALSRATPITRYTEQLDVRPAIPVAMPLRVLVMISAPKDFPALDVEGEWQRLQNATAELQKKGVLMLERLDSATLIALQRRLRAEDYQVFHYIGHSDFEPNSQQGVMVLEDDADETRSALITAADFSREIGEESTIRLVILNSCQSGRRAEEDPFAGIASSLVRRGIPAVVAMQFPISDQAAKVFAEEFYRAIAETLPIDGAVSEARRAIANRVQNAEWATPVLYMRSRDGILFRQVAATTRRTQPVQHQSRFRWGWLAAALVILALAIGGVAALSLTNNTSGSNLEIVSIRTAPRSPAPGQTFRLVINIRNSGETNSGPFSVAWDPDVNSDLLVEQVERIDNIPPGAEKTVSSLNYAYGWWNTYNSQIIVDIDGEVRESNERDNLRGQIINMVSDAPFVIDFSQLPNNEVVVPPRPVSLDDFTPWNLAFSLDTPDTETCGDAPTAIVEIADDLILTTNPLDADPGCARAPLVITTNLPVGNAIAGVIADIPGDAIITLYRDAEGQQPVAENTQSVTPGEVVQVGQPDNLLQAIRRIELSLPNQTTNLTELTLLPPAP
jgi:hypothetical protein